MTENQWIPSITPVNALTSSKHHKRVKVKDNICYIFWHMSNDPKLQPIRLWYEYLKTALKNNMKVDRVIYRSWGLDEIKRSPHDKGFDKWFKTHKHLFADEDTKMKLVKGGSAKQSDTILLQIPTNYNVRKVQTEIGEIVSEHLSQSNAKFSITSNRSLQIAPMDYMRWCWQLRQMPKFDKSVWGGLVKIHAQIEIKQTNRTKRRTWTSKNKRVVKGFAKDDSSRQIRNPAIMVSKNIRKADSILKNVCKGVFPGDYSVS